MNDIDEFLEVTAAIFVAVTVLMVWLTHLEDTLHADPKPRSGPAQSWWSGVTGAVRAWMKARRRG